jgi:hypothetical protein
MSASLLLLLMALVLRRNHFSTVAICLSRAVLTSLLALGFDRHKSLFHVHEPLRLPEWEAEWQARPLRRLALN